MVTISSNSDYGINPPVLTIQGDKDVVVPASQARLLDKKMKEGGATHALMILEGQPHGIRGKYRDKAFEAMYDFLDSHLKR